MPVRARPPRQRPGRPRGESFAPPELSSPPPTCIPRRYSVCKLERIELAVLETKANPNRFAGERAHVRFPFPRHLVTQAGRIDRIGLGRGETRDRFSFTVE